MKRPVALSKVKPPTLCNTFANRCVQNVTAGEIMYSWAILLFKVSALCLLQRIFPGRKFQHILWGVGAVVLAYTVTQTFRAIFTCVPINAAFAPSVKGRCINIVDLFLVCSSLNIAADFVILSLPMPKLWRLNVSKTHKVQLTFIFALGGT